MVNYDLTFAVQNDANAAVKMSIRLSDFKLYLELIRRRATSRQKSIFYRDAVVLNV